MANMSYMNKDVTDSSELAYWRGHVKENRRGKTKDGQIDEAILTINQLEKWDTSLL